MIEYTKASNGVNITGTLLRAVANVVAPNLDVQGDILFNSRRLRASDRRQILSFVAQESPLLGEFTVSETLWFAARLYFGYSEVPNDEIQLKIDDIIDALGLESCRDVLVGNLFFRGLSGGQRKRLSIAVELISSPACLVLDEPTSGLDSSAAMTLIQALRNLTKLGHTIMASVHQPSSKMWSEFSNVMLMSQGRCVYFGAADNSVRYFASLGLKCPDFYNPADYFSAVLSTDFASEEFHVKSPIELADIYDASSAKQIELSAKLESVERGRKTIAYSKGRTTTGSKDSEKRNSKRSSNKFDALSDTEANKGPSVFGASSMKQAGFLSATMTLTYRFLRSLYREPGLVAARIIAYIVLGIVLGLVYLNIGRSYDTEAMLARCSVLLGTVGFFSFLGVSAIPFIMDNRQVMERERANGAYPLLSYVVADVIALIPAIAVLTGIASVFVVFMISLNNFGTFYLTLFLMLFCVETLVHAVACMFTKMETAVAVAIGLFGIVFLCAGFFTPVNQMNWAIRWVSYVSPPRYAFRAFMRNEFAKMNQTNSLQFPDGNSMLEFFALNDDLITEVWQEWLVIIGMSLCYVITIYFCIGFLRR